MRKRIPRLHSGLVRSGQSRSLRVKRKPMQIVPQPIIQSGVHLSSNQAQQLALRAHGNLLSSREITAKEYQLKPLQHMLEEPHSVVLAMKRPIRVSELQAYLKGTRLPRARMRALNAFLEKYKLKNLEQVRERLTRAFSELERNAFRINIISSVGYQLGIDNFELIIHASPAQVAVSFNPRQNQFVFSLMPTAIIAAPFKYGK